MSSKYDYIELRTQYVRGDMSIRELCRLNGVRSWSTVNERARREDWEGLRNSFRRQVENKSIEALAEKAARKIAQIRLDALEVIHAGILKLATDMDATEPVMDGGKVLRDDAGDIVWRPRVRYGPRDLAILIEKYQSLTGQPQTIGEERHLGMSLSAEADHETLRDVLSLIRPRAAIAESSGEPETGNPSRTRPH